MTRAFKTLISFVTVTAFAHIASAQQTQFLDARIHVIQLSPTNSAPVGAFSGTNTMEASGSPFFAPEPGRVWRSVVWQVLDTAGGITYHRVPMGGTTAATIGHGGYAFLSDTAGALGDNGGAAALVLRNSGGTTVWSGLITATSNVAEMTPGGNALFFNSTSTAGRYHVTASGTARFGGSSSAVYRSAVVMFETMVGGRDYAVVPAGGSVDIDGSNLWVFLTDGIGTLGDNSGGFTVTVTSAPGTITDACVSYVAPHQDEGRWTLALLLKGTGTVSGLARVLLDGSPTGPDVPFSSVALQDDRFLHALLLTVDVSGGPHTVEVQVVEPNTVSAGRIDFSLTAFEPRVHGFQFGNTFSFFGLSDGLCTGMSATANNFFRSGVPIPTRQTLPPFFDPLTLAIRYNHIRYNAFNFIRFVQNWFQPNHATSWQAGLPVLRTAFNSPDSDPVVLGLPRPFNTWHTVLACGLVRVEKATTSGMSLTPIQEVWVYDPNFPNDRTRVVWATGGDGAPLVPAPYVLGGGVELFRILPMNEPPFQWWP